MNERFEWFVEKSVEIGIDEITPVICGNSERKIIKTERINRVAEAAMKQSYKAYHPQINEQINLEKFLKQNLNYKQKFIAHCSENDNKIYLGSVLEKQSSYLILIGPEGILQKMKFKCVKMLDLLKLALAVVCEPKLLVLLLVVLCR